MRKISRTKMLLLLVMALFILVLSGIGVVYYITDNKNDYDAYDIAAEGLDIEFNADIVVYGEDPKFRECVKYRVIDAITEENLMDTEEHGYRAIVLYDQRETMAISDEELLLIKKYVEEYGYDMIYLGRQYLDDFKRLGFTVRIQEDECSLEYIGSINVGKDVQQNKVGNLYAQHGLWRTDDEEFFGEKSDEKQCRIITIMYDYAKEAARLKK